MVVVSFLQQRFASGGSERRSLDAGLMTGWPYLEPTCMRKQGTSAGSGNSDRIFSEKSVRLDETINSDRLVADSSNEGKDGNDAKAVF